VGTVVLGSPIFMVPPKCSTSAGPRLFSKLMTKNSLEKYWISNLLLFVWKYAVSSANERIQFLPEMKTWVGIRKIEK